jgi:HlyD family secretion protein
VNLGYTEIVSPVDGVVVARNVDVGRRWPRAPDATLFLIAEDRRDAGRHERLESDVGRVREDTRRRSPSTRTAFIPRRRRAVPAPITVQNVVTYDVVIMIDNPDKELKPGMTANVCVTTARRDDVLRVPCARPLQARDAARRPTRARRRRPARSYVLGDDGRPAPVRVEVGIRNTQHAELTGGDLKDGMRAVVGVKRAPAPPTVTQPPGFGGGRR